MKRKFQSFTSDFCMECCALLMPPSTICQICGFDNSWYCHSDVPIEDEIPDEIIDESDFEDDQAV